MRSIVGWIVVILPCLGAARTSDGDEPFWVHMLPKAKAVIKVLDRGAEPRLPLRWKHIAGTREIGKASVEDVHHTGRNSTELRVAAAVTCLTDAVTRAGDSRCSCVFSDFEWTSTDPFFSTKAKAEDLVTWDGTTSRFTLGAQGLVKTRDALKMAPAVRSDLGLYAAVRHLQSMHAPYFPTEAVGVGARWEISGKPIAPWPVDETAVCTLTSRDGDRLTIDVALTRTAKPVPDRSGREIKHGLVRYAATGTGSYEVDLSLVLPLRAVMNVREQYRTSMYVGELEEWARFGLLHDSDCTWRLDFTGGRAGAITPR
jgi:hypothetical protein